MPAFKRRAGRFEGGGISSCVDLPIEINLSNRGRQTLCLVVLGGGVALRCDSSADHYSPGTFGVCFHATTPRLLPAHPDAILRLEASHYIAAVTPVLPSSPVELAFGCIRWRASYFDKSDVICP